MSFPSLAYYRQFFQRVPGILDLFGLTSGQEKRIRKQSRSLTGYISSVCLQTCPAEKQFSKAVNYSELFAKLLQIIPGLGPTRKTKGELFRWRYLQSLTWTFSSLLGQILPSQSKNSCLQISNISSLEICSSCMCLKLLGSLAMGINPGELCVLHLV